MCDDTSLSLYIRRSVHNNGLGIDNQQGTHILISCFKLSSDMCISLKSLDFFGLNIEKIQKSILTYINSTPNVHSITLYFLTLDIICSYLIAIPTFHLLFFNRYCRTFPFLPPSGPAMAA